MFTHYLGELLASFTIAMSITGSSKPLTHCVTSSSGICGMPGIIATTPPMTRRRGEDAEERSVLRETNGKSPFSNPSASLSEICRRERQDAHRQHRGAPSRPIAKIDISHIHLRSAPAIRQRSQLCRSLNTPFALRVAAVQITINAEIRQANRQSQRQRPLEQDRNSSSSIRFSTTAD